MTERDHSTAGTFTLDRDTKLVVDACSAKCWCKPEPFSQRDAPLMKSDRVEASAPAAKENWGHSDVSVCRGMFRQKSV